MVEDIVDERVQDIGVGASDVVEDIVDERAQDVGVGASDVVEDIVDGRVQDGHGHVWGTGIGVDWSSGGGAVEDVVGMGGD